MALGIAAGVVVAAGIHSVPNILGPIFLALVLTITVDPVAGEHFLVKEAPSPGKAVRWVATPLLAALVVVEVTDVVDHDWAKSIYFKDPNGIQLEFCCYTRNLNADDARMQHRAEISVRRLGLEDPVALSSAPR